MQCLWICQKLSISYLKGRKQNIRINNTPSIFQILNSGVPQGSILGQILFNVLINDLLLWKSYSELINFADENTISKAENIFEELIITFGKKSQAVIDLYQMKWLIILTNFKQLFLREEVINSENYVKLLACL